MSNQVRQRPVADIVRAFADLLDSEQHKEALAKVDPLRLKLADMLDAVGKFAERCGVILQNVEATVAGIKRGVIVRRNLTDELRRFADVLERRHDKVREVDPGYCKLISVVKAMSLYASWLGADLGVGKRGVISGKKFPGV